MRPARGSIAAAPVSSTKRNTLTRMISLFVPKVSRLREGMASTVAARDFPPRFKWLSARLAANQTTPTHQPTACIGTHPVSCVFTLPAAEASATHY